MQTISDDASIDAVVVAVVDVVVVAEVGAVVVSVVVVLACLTVCTGVAVVGVAGQSTKGSTCTVYSESHISSSSSTNEKRTLLFAFQ